MNVPVLDLTGVRDRAALKHKRLENIAVVLVPEDLPDLLAGVACENVAAIVPVPPGTRVEPRIGQLEIAGPTLEAADDRSILLLVGQAVVTPPVTKVGYRAVLLVGQIVLPKSAEPLLAGKVLCQVGQVAYYEGDNPRVFLNDARLTRAFFELVDEPLTLVLVGDATFAADVTPELLRQKVRGIVLVGDATLENPDLEPLVEYMAKNRVGDITVVRGDGTP